MRASSSGFWENAWYALTFLAATLSASRVLRPTWALHLMALGACLAGVWALFEAYGVDPLRLVDADARVGINVQATLGTSELCGGVSGGGARLLGELGACYWRG